MKLFLALFLVISFQQVYGDTFPNGFTPEQEQWMADQNRENFVNEKNIFFDEPENPLTKDLLENTSVRAVAEYEEAGYLIFSSSYDYKSRKAKLTMAKNIPDDVKLVVFTYSNQPSHIKAVRDEYKGYIDLDRLKIIYLPGAQKGFWARDGVPVPVWRKGNLDEKMFTVVDAPYYHYFEADQEVSQHFYAKRTKHTYFYEGGNFMTNSKNECLVVNKPATAQIPDSIFEDHYGCEKLVRLPFIKGIGHADESVKFVNDTTVLTDAPSYKTILENAGYTVKMLPRPFNEYETYVNALLVNGVMFVPIFNQSGDEKALDVYRSLGFEKVIGIYSGVLSNQGLGSLHCITMTYPKVTFTELIDYVGGEAL
jgi:agmatine/peptidylarginine deiminase